MWVVVLADALRWLPKLIFIQCDPRQNCLPVFSAKEEWQHRRLLRHQHPALSFTAEGKNKIELIALE